LLTPAEREARQSVLQAFFYNDLRKAHELKKAVKQVDPGALSDGGKLEEVLRTMPEQRQSVTADWLRKGGRKAVPGALRAVTFGRRVGLEYSEIADAMRPCLEIFASSDLEREDLKRLTKSKLKDRIRKWAGIGRTTLDKFLMLQKRRTE